MATRPKGYLPKGKVKSADASSRAKARASFTPKGIGKLIINSVLDGVPAGKSVKAGRAVSKALKVASKAKPLANPKSAVKVLPRKTAPKSDLSSRGARLTPKEKASRASDLDFGKAEKNYDASNEMRYTGLRSYPKGYEKSTARGPGKRNARKAAAIKKEANKVNIYEKENPVKKPIKINSQRNLKKK